MKILLKVMAVLLLLVAAHYGYKATQDEYNTYKKDNLPDYNVNQDLSAKAGEPLVALKDENGKTFCSGTVISDDYVLTAAHCLMDHDSFIPGLKKDKINIVDGPNNAISYGYAVALNQRSDVALIQGDFSSFSKAMILLRPTDLVRLTGPFVTCGFPRGAGSSCFQSGQFRLYGDFLIAPGYMFFGMSGGPVVDIPTGIVFAVNTAVADGIIVAPIIGLFQMFDIKIINQ